jgi:2-phospho-L-lactate guanylyltransferase
MRTFGLLPIKRLSEAKSRLSRALSPEVRSRLTLLMLKDVLDALGDLDGVVLISPEDLREHLEGHEVLFLREEAPRGIGRAVELGTRLAVEEGADATLFLPGDIPLLQERHIRKILALGKEHPLILSPSRRGGIAIVFRRPPDLIENRFTSQSFADHLQEARRRGIDPYIYESFSLSLDLDTPEDLREFLRYGRGTRTFDALREIEREAF